MEHLAVWSIITAAVSLVLPLARAHVLRPVRVEARVARSAPVQPRSGFHGPA